MDKNQISKMLDDLDRYPFHMPGHKRNTALVGSNFPYDRDITEITGSDNLHDMNGIILAECERAARVWGGNRAHILVNGSTCGILAAIRAYGGHDRAVIVARNCHKSVYNGIELCRLKPTYLYPEIDRGSGICGSITPESVEIALRNSPEAKLVILTSPTYEGVISDIAGIARVAHACGARLLVDAAHGAHLGLGDFVPHPVTLGADIVICSLHKTLPAPTQTALALIGNACPDAEMFSAQLAVFQTSSPSYVLMEQAARCIRLVEEQGSTLAADWKNRLIAFEKAVSHLAHLRLCFRAELPDCTFAYDPGKLVISTRSTNVSGHELARVLRDDYKIEIEMAASDYIIAMTSLADTDMGFERLAFALCEIDARLDARKPSATLNVPVLQAVCAPWEAADHVSRAMPLRSSCGCVCAEYVWAYPPGIPLVIPGERIDRKMLSVLDDMRLGGTELHSTRGSLPETLYVVDDLS